MPPRPLRVINFNVRRLSRHELTRARRIGAFLGELGADICALQEIEHPHESISPLAEIARVAGMEHRTFTNHAPSHSRGVAILHRNVPLARSGARLPARRGDDKGYTRLVVEASADRPIEIIAVHLDPFSRHARLRQIADLAGNLEEPRMPRLVLGDLNAMTVAAWMKGKDHDETTDVLAEKLGVKAPIGRSPRTFPSVHPLFAIDWILASPDLEFRSVRAVPTRLSDHAALVAELDLRA